jgi:hypothetical protein
MNQMASGVSQTLAEAWDGTTWSIGTRRGTQEGLHRSHAIDKGHDAIEAFTAQVLKSPSSVRRPTFVE